MLKFNMLKFKETIYKMKTMNIILKLRTILRDLKRTILILEKICCVTLPICIIGTVRLDISIEVIISNF